MGGPYQLSAILIFVAFIFNGVEGLKDVSVKIPLAVTPGDTVTLHCLYDLENEPLYTVKWYKGRQEFFRYIPKELPHTKVFPLPGFHVDVAKSGANDVVLRDVQLSMAGKYRCEVSADAPLFHTTMVSGYMHVVYLPEGEPKLALEKQRYSIGDTLRGNCTSGPSYPPANLTWILNGKQVNESFLLRITMDNDIPPPPAEILESTDSGITSDTPAPPPQPVARRQSTIIGLQLELTADNFLAGRLQLECIATVLQLYKRRARLQIEEEKPRLASVLSTRDTNDASCLHRGEFNKWLLVVAVFIASGTFTR